MAWSYYPKFGNKEKVEKSQTGVRSESNWSQKAIGFINRDLIKRRPLYQLSVAVVHKNVWPATGVTQQTTGNDQWINTVIVYKWTALVVNRHLAFGEEQEKFDVSQQ